MSKAKTARTLDDYRGEYDKSVVVPNRIQQALDELRKQGAENWVYENELVGLARISQTDLGLFRGQFEDHIVEARQTGKANKRIWFADPKVAAKARGDK